MTGYPWDKGRRRVKRLDPELYSEAQRIGAAGLIPMDHPIWKQDVRDERPILDPKQIDELPDAIDEAWATDAPPPAFVDRDGPPVICRCGEAFIGERLSHCPSCHITFTSLGGFDDHRTGQHGVLKGARRRRCRTQSELRERGYQPNAHGYWRIPRPPGTLPKGNSPDGPQD